MDLLGTAAAADAEAGGSRSDSEYRQASRVDTFEHTSLAMSHPRAMGMGSSADVNANSVVSDGAGTELLSESNNLFLVVEHGSHAVPACRHRGRASGAY